MVSVLLGVQVIRQPDEMYALFSTGIGRWLNWDMSEAQVTEWFVARAVAATRDSLKEVLTAVGGGRAGEVYCDDALTFAEANALSHVSGGEVLEGPLDGEMAKVAGFAADR